MFLEPAAGIEKDDVDVIICYRVRPHISIKCVDDHLRMRLSALAHTSRSAKRGGRCAHRHAS